MTEYHRNILASMKYDLKQKIDEFIRSSSQKILGTQQDLIDIILADWREIERYLTNLKKDKDDKQWYAIETILLMIIQLKCPKHALADSKQSAVEQQIPQLDIDRRCTSNENELVKQGVITKEELEKLKDNEKNQDSVVKTNAKQDLDFLLKPQVWNAVKKEYVRCSAQMALENKIALLLYLTASEGTNENAYVLMYLSVIALAAAARKDESLLSFKEFQKQQGISPSPSVPHLGG